MILSTLCCARYSFENEAFLFVSSNFIKSYFRNRSQLEENSNIFEIFELLTTNIFHYNLIINSVLLKKRTLFKISYKDFDNLLLLYYFGNETQVEKSIGIFEILKNMP